MARKKPAHDVILRQLQVLAEQFGGLTEQDAMRRAQLRFAAEKLIEGLVGFYIPQEHRKRVADQVRAIYRTMFAHREDYWTRSEQIHEEISKPVDKASKDSDKDDADADADATTSP